MKRIVIVSDTHSTSIYGLNPPSWVADKIKSPFSEWVWNDAWIKFCKEFKNPDYLLLDGDLVDGSQEITKGVDAIATSTDKQVEMSVECLSLLKGNKTEILGTNGSGYHGGERLATCMDKRIIEALGGKFVGDVLNLPIGNELIQLAHGSGGSINNPESHIKMEMKRARDYACKRRILPPTILIRGHMHLYHMMQDNFGMTGIINPCWQFATPFMRKKSVNIVPDIGATIIEIDNGNPRIYSKRYPIPEEVWEGMNGFEYILEETKRKSKKESKQNQIEYLRNLPK